MSEVACAIVGGGIAGASVAYHLARRGVDGVVLFEQGETASETTAKSFAMFGTYGDETQFRLKRYGLQLYNRLAREDPEIKYERIGHLSVATTEASGAKFERAVEANEGDAGTFATGGDRTSVQYLDGDEIEERVFFPALDTSDVTAAVYRPEVGYFDPVPLADAMLSRAQAEDVEVRENAHVTDVHVEDGSVTGIAVNGDAVEAGSVVLTAGPWTPFLAETAGVDLPVKHSLAPVLVIEHGDQNQTLPSLKHHESNFNLRGNVADGTVYVGKHTGGYDHGKRIEPSSVPSSVPVDLRIGATTAIERFVPSLSDAPLVDEWVGVRSLTPDGNPIVGWTSVEGLSVVAFNTSGIQLSPGIGRIIAKQFVDDDPTAFYDALSVSRFDGYEDVR